MRHRVRGNTVDLSPHGSKDNCQKMGRGVYLGSMGTREGGTETLCARLDSIPSKKLHGVWQGQEGGKQKQALGP